MLAEYSTSRILKIAWPIIVGGVFTNLVTVVDTAFLGRVGAQELGGAGNAGILFFICVLVGAGLTTGSQIIMARRNGEQNYASIGEIFLQTAIALFLIFLVFLSFIQLFAAPLIKSITQSDEIYKYIMEYLKTRSWGLLFNYLNALFIAFYIAITQTKIIGRITPIIALINIVLDYGLIQGNLGMPALGVKGAAIASNISEIIGFILFLSFSLRRNLRLNYGLFNKFKFKLSRSIQPLLFKVGGPVMIQNFLSISAWFVFFISIEKMGENELAISHIIRSIYIFLMIPVFALGNTTNTLVSNLMGMEKFDEIYKVIAKTIGMGILISFLMFLVLQINPESVLSIFTQDTFLIQYALKTYNTITYAMFFLSVGMILFFAVSGTGKTLIALLVESVNVVIYIVLLYYFTQIWHLEIHQVWYSEFIYFSGMSLLSLLFFKFYPWRKKSF